MPEHIAILDFGSQYTHLIARNIREMKVLARIYPHDVAAEELSGAKGIILSGGPQSVYEKNALRADDGIFSLDVPILGLCYGHQLIAQTLGGRVNPGKIREYGRARLNLRAKSALFDSVKRNSQVWMSHGDTVVAPPDGFVVCAATPDCPVTAMADEERKIYGLQFHPEVDHTHEGRRILENFVLRIARAPKNWEIKDIVLDLETRVRLQVGERKVFMLVSGGVDSNVAFALLTRALGPEKVKGLYIDTGFMRQDESQEIILNFRRIGFDNLEIRDAGKLFLERLAGVSDPETKRRIIGQTFLDVKDAAAQELGLDSDEWLLGQGTIYPDIIESGGTKNADRIKTHHNRVDAIQKMIEQGRVVEPLVDFYKYEVRRIGRLLKLPRRLVERHPFPGPGLAIRTLCTEKSQKKNDLKKLEMKIKKFCRRKNARIDCRVLDIRSVGVQGDNRTYAHPLAVWGENAWKKLDALSSDITNAFKEINRVILWLDPSKNSVFISGDKDYFLTAERLSVLREADAIVTKNIRAAGLYDRIWQFPVVLIPITDRHGRESIVLRPVNTRDAMTLDFYQMEKRILKKIVKELLATGHISHVFYDLTNKPPGTTEWE